MGEGEKERYIGQKGYPTQNVLAHVDFDTRFTFVYAGWEGSAHDSKVLSQAIQHPRRIQATKGNQHILDCHYFDVCHTLLFLL